MDNSNLYANCETQPRTGMKNQIEISDRIKKEYARTAPGHVLEAKYFYYETEPDHSKELAIIYGGYEKCAPDFEVKRKTYPWYVIEYPIKGNCSLKINSRTHLLQNGVLAGFAPGSFHHYKCDPASPMEHIFIAFTGTEAQNLFYISNLSSIGAIGIYDAERASHLIEAIMQNGFEKSEYSQQLSSCYLRTLLLEQACNTISPGQQGSKSISTYRKCRRYIDNNFSTIFSPQQVADSCGINVRYMSRLFKRYHNITPHKHIMRLKLNKAATLLLTSSLSVKEIASLVGFDDPYHFSRNFKRFHGRSPHHYRIMHK